MVHVQFFRMLVRSNIGLNRITRIGQIQTPVKAMNTLLKSNIFVSYTNVNFYIFKDSMRKGLSTQCKPLPKQLSLTLN